MANHRIEEVFVANHAIGNDSGLSYGFSATEPIFNTNNINSFSNASASVIENVVGLVNADTNFLIFNNTSLNNAKKVRFIVSIKGREYRLSDVIDRKKIVSLNHSFWQFYHPVVYKIDLTSATVSSGDKIKLNIRLRQEEDMDYLLLQYQYTFTSNFDQDKVNIVNGINELVSNVSRNHKPLKVFLGNNATAPNILFNGAILSSAHNVLYFIAGKRGLDRQNIRQLEIYDFDIIQAESYRKSTDTYSNDWIQLFPSSTKQKGTINGSYNYNSPEPIIYNNNGEAINKGATAYQFMPETSTLSTAKRPSEGNGFYEDIVSHIYQTDLGQVLGHTNRFFLPDNPYLPNILKNVTGAFLELTNRYNSYHIEYIDHAIDNSQQNQASTKTKRFTLYYNASLLEAGNILSILGNSTTSFIGSPPNYIDGFRALIENLPL